MKPLIGLALVFGDAILAFAAKDSYQAHQAHGRTLGVYVALVLLSLVLWALLHAAWKKSRPTSPSRPGGYPYGGQR